MNLNIMPKLITTNISLYLNKRSNHKMMTHNNQILSSKTLCFINDFFWVEMEFEPCNFFNPFYQFEIYHVMIFSSTCEMKWVTYHNIVMSKISK
jgi:hypothetical protein